MTPRTKLPPLMMIVMALMAAMPFMSELVFAQMPTASAPMNGSTPQPLAAVEDPLGRETPEGLVQGFLDAVADENYERAAQYLDLRRFTDAQAKTRGPELARTLQQLIDQGGWFVPRLQLSGEILGRRDDNLAQELEKVGGVRTTSGIVDLLAERVTGIESYPIWLMSSVTVANIPTLIETTTAGLLDRILPQVLVKTRWAGVPLGHWGALVGLAGLAYLVAWILTTSCGYLLHRLWRGRADGPAHRILEAAALPFRLYLAVWIFALSAFFLGVSIVARKQFGLGAEIVAWMSVAWLLWRIIDGLSEASVERMSKSGHVGALSAVSFFRRFGKGALLVVVVVATLDTLGVDVTAGLAALGIGGLAVALGAQKTVENFVGSLTLIADQPIRVGDFCRFGDTLGTVEDIGMRSTRVRTLQRTVVAIPNGDFSSLQIENYSRRDRFWFHPTLGLRYETTPDQIRNLLVELRSLLYAHPCVDPDPARVRFLGLGEDSLKLEIFAYVHAKDYGGFLEIQEDLTLRIMEIVAAGGASFAFPSRTLYLAQDPAIPRENVGAAEARVRQWSSDGELQLPAFHGDRIAALRNTLVYPPPGSAIRPTPNGRDEAHLSASSTQ